MRREGRSSLTVKSLDGHLPGRASIPTAVWEKGGGGGGDRGRKY